MTSAELIKSRLDVVTFIQGYLKLEKAGVNFKARCPFHSEKTPSFFVSPARDSWHCFGCSKGGDIFAFVMELEGLTFPEALHALAERAGVELAHESSGDRGIRSRLLELLEEATKFYEENLVSEAGVLQYLSDRGLTKETMQEFRIGFAPDSWRALSDHLHRKEFSDTEIDKAGLSVAGNRGPYDRFRSRIIFPLEDAQGRVIGFGGRIFSTRNEPIVGGKYINSPQTALYDKSRYLYGFSKSKGLIREEKSAVVVEGYMDAILSYQAGVRNVVAVSGTALTEHHIKILRRIAESALFAFDVDAAGIDASRRAVNLAHREDFHVRIVDIKGGKDPADMAKDDPEAWRAAVAGAGDGVAFFLKKATAKYSLSDPLSKKKIGEEVLPLIAELANEIEKAHWLKELAHILKISEEALWRELTRVQQGIVADVTVSAGEAAVPQLTRKARLEERMVGLLLIEPQLLALGEIPRREEATLLSTGVLFEELPKRAQNATVEELLHSLPDDIRQYGLKLAFEADIVTGQDRARDEEFSEALHAWRELSIKEKLSRLRDEIEEFERQGDLESKQTYMQEFQTLAAHLASIMTLHSHDHAKQSHQKEKK